MNTLFVSFENDILQDFITRLTTLYLPITPIKIVKTLNTDLSSSSMPLLVLDKVSYSGWKLLDFLIKDVKEEEKGEFYAFYTLLLQELSPLLLEFNDTLDVTEYSKEYPWPLHYILWTVDFLKKKPQSKNTKDKKEILGIIDKYVTGKDLSDKKLVDYWIYCSINAIYKCKDEKLHYNLKGCKGIQEFMTRFQPH